MDRRSLITKIREKRGPLLAGAALFIIFYGIYLDIGFSFAKTQAFKEYNILFGADTPRAIDDIAVFSADHHRTSVHPLYVALVNPLGVSLKHFFHSKVAAAVAVNSFFGTLAVCLAFVFFLVFGARTIDGAILASLFGFSMSQLFFSSVPETASLATCTLILTYTVFLAAMKNKPPSLAVWVLAGVLTLGVTTTNFVQTAICFMITLVFDRQKGRGFRWFALIRFMVVVFFITALFSVIQKAVNPSSRLFFAPDAFREETDFVGAFIFRKPFELLRQLAKHFLLVNVIAPLPDVLALREGGFPAVTFENSWNYPLAGWAGLAGWVCAFAAGIASALRDRQRTGFFFAGIALCFLFNLALHSIYNGGNGRIEVFLYTGNLTFLVMTFLCAYFFSGKILVRVFSVVLLLLAAFNNVAVMRYIIGIYK